MCVPGCQEVVKERMSRRGFLKAAAAATMAAAVAPAASQAVLADEADEASIFVRPAHRVVDLTHTLWPEFPTYFGEPQLEVNPLFTYDPDFFNLNEWKVNEHTGTHMDAPLHFSPPGTAYSAEMIPVADLVLPLVVVDIRAKAEANADAQLTPEDLHAWERRYGRIPERACVAMLSGWADKVQTEMFRNVGADGAMHFPGFHLEAADFLIEERNAAAIMVDTLSLDYGPSADFAVHYRWLPSNRWGMENVANLDKLPPKGSTIVAGSPKIEGATGGPSRVIALVHRPERGRGR